jgi:hypothetical protein
MHGQFLPLGMSSARRAEFMLSCIAGCAAVSGRSYYTTELRIDVPRRLRRREASLHVLRDVRDAWTRGCERYWLGQKE